MKILIDADGCPVVDITIALSKKHNIECILLCDTSHVFEKVGARTVTVSKGADSVDFALVNMAQKGDVVVTQDYGLAAMCLARAAKVISQDGMIYNDFNIDSLLNQRYVAKKIRMAGGRLSGNSKRTKEQDKKFEVEMEKLLMGQ
ncbi:MAG: YaiI/YqxD family protein [Bacillota bacterium]